MPMSARVTTADAELEFAIQSGTTGREFFEKVTKALGVREAKYFGLRYTDSAGFLCWLDLGRKKITKQDIRKEVPLKFHFLAKYFPENVDELILFQTKQLFYKQVRNMILADEYFCSAETAVLLASYDVQIKYGDYDEETHKPGFLEQEKLLPSRIIKQHTLTKAEWDDKVLAWYKEHKGLSKEAAMMEYLKIVQDLEMYGVSYFDITNKKLTKLWLGVDALGINVYDRDDKLTPKIGFPWNEVSNIRRSGNKLIIKPTDRTAPEVVFMAPKSSVSEQIYHLCEGNFDMYARRRKPPSIEELQLVKERDEERLFKERERQKLLAEQRLREESEKQNKQLEQQIQIYAGEIEASKKDLERSQEIAAELEKKLVELQRNSIELEESRKKAEEAKRLAEAAANAEKAERELKEFEAARAQALLEEKMEEARQREFEAKTLQEELEQAKIIISQRLLVKAEAEAFQTALDDLNISDHEERKPIDSNHLQDLKLHLEQSKVESEMTKNDLIYVRNVREGRDKYKTLKQIRQGNTKIRVDIFESL